MAFFIISIALGILILVLLMFTVYMYVKLVIAVRTNTEVPNWMYKIGQGFKSKININYEDFTEPAALWDTNFFYPLFYFSQYFFLFCNVLSNTKFQESILYMCRLAGRGCFDSNVILLYSKTDFIFCISYIGNLQATLLTDKRCNGRDICYCTCIYSMDA